MVATADATLGHQVVDTATAVFVAGVPVLHGAVFHFGALFHNDFHDGGVELVLVALRCGAAFEIRHIAVVVGNNQRALKLAGLCGIDAEIRRQFHWATHALWNIHKRAIAEHRRIKRGIKVVGIRHHRAHVFLHKVGVVFHRLADRAENHAKFGELLAIGGVNAHAVHDGIYRHARQAHLLFQRNAQLVESFLHLRVDFLLWGALARRSVVADVLEVDVGNVHVSPFGLGQREPVAERLQTELQQPFRLALECRDLAHHILVKPFRDNGGFDIGHEAVLVFFTSGFVDDFLFFVFFVSFNRIHYCSNDSGFQRIRCAYSPHFYYLMCLAYKITTFFTQIAHSHTQFCILSQREPTSQQVNRSTSAAGCKSD